MSDEQRRPSDLKKQRQRSSLFQRARKSFYRSKGNRGADVQTLRGTRGADFEAEGRILRGAEGIGCFCCGSVGNENKDRLILVKGPFCFVFSGEDSPSPKYAIGLQFMRPEVKPSQMGRTLVVLEDNTGDEVYEVSFSDAETANKFAAVVKAQAASAQTEEVRKRLGHEHLLNKRASVRYAESIAKKKIEDKPDKPMSTEEIVSNIPATMPM